MLQASPSLQHPLRRRAEHPAYRDPLSVWATSAEQLAGCCACRRAAVILLALVLPLGAAQAPSEPTPADLTELSLESLLDIEVTSVSRRGQKLSQSASPIYVITQEDIRRSGVTTIPDALRSAPGVQVMQIDGTKWAVSIRGLTGLLSNKLLVMIDGRSVYSPIFAGTYWETNDVLLEDVDRIEVIRGPGATMWGSNAVNGVINILTKHSRETQGGLVTAGGGNQEGGFGAARFGGQAGPGRHYRVYSKYNSRSGLLLPSGERANDNWSKLQGGFRMDWEFNQRDELSLSGDVYEGHGGEVAIVSEPQPPFLQLVPYRTTASGSNLLARWTRKHAEGSMTQVQAYFDHNSRDDLRARATSYSLGDIEFQHQRDLSRHRVMFGAGYRVSKDSTPFEWPGTFAPRQKTLQRVNAFVQDEIALLPGRLLLTVGSKLENNTYTEWVIQPSASLLWNVTDQNTVWLAASRAGRTPARVDRELIFNLAYFPVPDGSLLLLQIRGSDEFDTEYLNAYEAGYRFSPARRLSFDLTAFYNEYKGLPGLREGRPVFIGGVPPITVLPVVFANLIDTDIYGAEAAAAWNPLKTGGLRVSHSFLRGGIADPASTMGPAHQLQMFWRWNLADTLEWDSGYSFAGRFDGVRAYHGVESRLGWRPSPHWEFSIAGRNLLDNQRAETSTTLDLPNEVGRSVYGKLTWRFGER